MYSWPCESRMRIPCPLAALG